MRRLSATERTTIVMMNVLTAPALLCLVAPAHAETVLYVDANATGPAHDGSTWCRAYTKLYEALAVATEGTTIRVADGTYKPDVRGWPDPRAATFYLFNGVTIQGGYAGCGAPSPDDRNIDLYKTILSGDLNGDDGQDFTNYDENTYHVVTGSYTHTTAVLDGVTITGGNANVPGPRSRGGGMFSESGYSRVTNCTFSGNSAEGGGGMYNKGGRPTVTNCTFSGNTATYGGGIYDWDSNPTLTNCTFSSNSAQRRGGGMHSDGGSPTLTNCAFTGNSAGDYGGGIYNADSSPTLANCTLHGNAATTGRAVYSYSSDTRLTNCILWNGGNEVSGSSLTITTITYSNIYNGHPGAGNIFAMPLFVDPDGWDDVPGTNDDDLRLLPGSPCIDAGDKTAVPQDTLDLDGDGDTSERIPFDLGGSARLVDDPTTPDTGNGTAPIVDMGAYEFGDCNANGVSDWNDIAAGTSRDCNDNTVPDECEPQEDCNENGAQDICDIADHTSSDCNNNRVPDDCEADCNENTVPDDCDIADQTSMDCNENSIPDECDIAEGTSGDCNTNGTPDECEPDDDGDGVMNDCDQCPATLPLLVIGDDGCPVPFGPCCFADGPCIDDTEDADCALVGGSYLGDGLTCVGDPDQDSAYGCDDRCPLDPDKTEPGICGCGVPDDDTDRDGVVGCLDSCPDTESSLPVNRCGCPALGACCFAVGVCWDDVEPDDCAVIEGVYQGDGSVCADGCGFGDTNADHNVDLADFAAFQRCFGSEADAIPECSRLDITVVARST